MLKAYTRVAVKLAAGLALGTVLAGLAEARRMAATGNEHVVVPDRAYRSGQPRPGRLARLARECGLRTVVSLRGDGAAPWAVAEATEAQELGLSLETITLSATHPPAPAEVRRLIEVFDRSEHPLLIHCQSGADRTGLAATAYLLLLTDADLPTARRQLSVRYGHVPVRGAGVSDRFFDQYAGWLAAQGEVHTPDRFRQWATATYRPGRRQARLEVIATPVGATVGQPAVVTLRAHNVSGRPWKFRAGTGVGIHAVFAVEGPGGADRYFGRAGLFDRRVQPGEWVDLDLAIPRANTAGRHRLLVDLYLAHVAFGQCGAQPVTVEWNVEPPGGHR